MKSRISIEVDFDNGNTPVIQILQASSDDVRDKLVKAFTEQLGGSSWCKINWVGEDNPFNRIIISPVKPEELKSQSAIMLEQHELYENWVNSKKIENPDSKH